MTEAVTLIPDYIFEVSWEVCNKVGGIYTVLATKAQLQERRWQEQLIFIGPDIWKGQNENPDFIEDKTLFKLWKQHAEEEGLKIKIGRWNVPGKPIAVLVDFTPYFHEKNDIFRSYWVNYHLDSITGQWDYIEPALFGYAAGKVIDCYYRCHINSTDKVIAQFHEWMTGTGVLYLKDNVPQIATVFTTHATVTGRVIAGNGLPFYRDFETFNAEQITRELNVVAKHSLEKAAAVNADCFTTVSENTAAECTKFLGKTPDIITHNGFDPSIVPDKTLFDVKRDVARKKIIHVARALFNQNVPENSLLVIKSGRYEFKNKGIDIFLDALASIKNNVSTGKTIVGLIFVPGHQTGPRKELQEKLAQLDFSAPPLFDEYLTHNLQGMDTDPVIGRIRQNKLDNSYSSRVKVIFVPSYMDGNDGIFNLSYYDLLIGFDLAVFPSYYEPWGYTPLESLAFNIPAITTDISGFGKVINTLFQGSQKGLYVVERNDDNEKEVVRKIAEIIESFTQKSDQEIHSLREEAHKISLAFSWDKQFIQYEAAYALALQKSLQRAELYANKPQAEPLTVSEEVETRPSWRSVTIQEALPEILSGLYRLSRNLWWSWNSEAEELFEYIDTGLWDKSHHNPVVFLQSINYRTIKNLQQDKIFLKKLQVIENKFDQYLKADLPNDQPRVAYFSMEYGIHNSIKLYSGGLGILAGDYLKEASDRGINMVAVGLLYKNGYFKQTLSIHGDQLVEPDVQDFSKLPLDIVKDKHGNPLKITLPFPGRQVYILVWKLDIGRVPLYLMDTFVNENSIEDRGITSRLYEGPKENRLRQEILLGLGGVQLLNELNIKPDVFHCNEGHAAFTCIGRIHELVQQENLSFEEAAHVIRATTLFTTHTSVPAAIDTFSEELLRPYFSHMVQHFNIEWRTFMNMGRAGAEDADGEFSMANLAARFSGEINAVSRIHREVSCKLFNVLWENYRPEELHIGYVTNGVHYSTWAANEWKSLYTKTFGEEFEKDLSNPSLWKKIDKVPDSTIWDIKNKLKKSLIEAIKYKLNAKLKASHESPRKIMEIVESLDERALIIGFAKRFVSYKRPDLLFSDRTRLKEILNNTKKPVLILYSGKAHPDDGIGNGFVKEVVTASIAAEFNNKILFLEDYDINLARLLIQGADLWLNTPNRCQEASGTSGMKAMLNGGLNFSILDGWWAEAYHEQIGWALEANPTYSRQDFQDELDAGIVYRTLENEIIPLYFKRNNEGIPEEWIGNMKAAIKASAGYTMTRVLNEYRQNYYRTLYERGKKICAEHFSVAREVVAWQKRITTAWRQIDVLSINTPGDTKRSTLTIEEFYAKVELDIGTLSINDVGIEIVILDKDPANFDSLHMIKEMSVVATSGERVTFESKLEGLQPGIYEYGFRIFPKSPLLKYRQDFPIVKWI